MDKMVLRGAQVLLDNEFADTDILVKNGRIAELGKNLEGDVLRISGYVLPGLIDEHIHGIHGYDTMDGAQAVAHMSRQLACHGVTSFLPTTMNAGVEETRAALMGIKEAMRENADGASIAGAHMEGPFLGDKYKGAQDARANLLPTMENFECLTADAANIVRLITIAPELDGAEEFVRAMTAKGIVVSAGHTDATYEVMEQAVGWGVRQATHLFNCMSPLHHRAPGVTGAALTLEEISSQVIADGIHLHPAAVKLAVRSGANVLLITDAMMAADMEDGVYELGGQTVYVKEGAARLASGNLAGSTLTLDQGVRNAMRFASLSLAQAVQMASVRVAASLGLWDRGRIACGLRADLCVLDDDLMVDKTIVAGKILYERF